MQDHLVCRMRKGFQDCVQVQMVSTEEDCSSVYPISLVITGKPCLVVGGGRVASRKVAGLVRSGAKVTVVARRVDPSILSHSEVKVLVRNYQPGEASDYWLVFAATGVKEVDRQVAADAHEAKVWVNCADDPQGCSFMLPAVHCSGSVSVAVSTAGSSPALARWVRDRIAEGLDPRIGEIGRLLQLARQRLKSEGIPTETVDWNSMIESMLTDDDVRSRGNEENQVD